jgi:hypothetical protein
MIEQRGVVRFLWAKKYGSKGYPQRNAAHMGSISLRSHTIQFLKCVPPLKTGTLISKNKHSVILTLSTPN